jgi:3-(3-hydroxy-phenyl)propionate hydroxylase
MGIKDSVIVAGGGPVGVVAALAAARAGFRVTLLEAAGEVDRNPRAATTHPSTLEMIDRVGLLNRFVAEGLIARHFQFWDRETGEKIAEFDHELLRNDTRFPFVVQTEQHKLVMMGMDALRCMPNAAVRQNACVTGVVQDADGVTVEVAGETGDGRLRADWLIGADGGRSTVRKTLGIEFEGYTWPERFLVLTVLDDMDALIGCTLRTYFAGRGGEWTNLFKVAGDDGRGRWRAVFPARVDEPEEEAMSDAAVNERLQGLYPNPAGYTVLHRNIYNVHQRVATRFRENRVFLAGDSSHLNNPIGGLGLNFGIHDAIDLVDTLCVHVFHDAPEAALDGYERRRRRLNVEFVQRQTVENKKRLEETDPEIRRSRLDELRAIAADPAKARAFLLRTSLIESVRLASAIS